MTAINIAAFALTCLLGLATGFLSGAFGIGGGIVSTPSIRLILMKPPGIALGTTLPLCIPAAFTGGINFLRYKKVNGEATKLAVSAGFLASAAGAYSTRYLNLHWLMVLTAILIIYFSLRTFRQSYRTGGKKIESIARKNPGHSISIRWRYLLTGLTAGLMSGLLGLGGGFILVPGFFLWAGLELKEAVGTSLVTITVIAIPGTVVHAFLGHIDWWIFLALAIGVIPGSYLGSRFTLKAQDRLVLFLFSFLLFATGIIFLIEELNKIFR